MIAPLWQAIFVHLIAGCLCMCMRHCVLFLSLFEVSCTQHIQSVSTNLSYRIASPCFCAWAASAKSWLICRRSHTCLYLSTLLNLYITLCRTTLMVSNTQQYLPVCHFQQFLDANSSTYHQQHVQWQFVSLGQLLVVLDHELISAFWTSILAITTNFPWEFVGFVVYGSSFFLPFTQTLSARPF